MMTLNTTEIAFLNEYRHRILHSGGSEGVEERIKRIFEWQLWFEKCFPPSLFTEFNFPSHDVQGGSLNPYNKVEDAIVGLSKMSNARKGKVRADYAIDAVRRWFFFNYAKNPLNQHITLLIAEDEHKSGNSHIHCAPHFEKMAPEPGDVVNRWSGHHADVRRMGAAYAQAYDKTKWGIPYMLGCHRRDELITICPGNRTHCKKRHKAGYECDYAGIASVKKKALGL